MMSKVSSLSCLLLLPLLVGSAACRDPEPAAQDGGVADTAAPDPDGPLTGDGPGPSPDGPSARDSQPIPDSAAKKDQKPAADGPPPSTTGKVVITEFLADPDEVSDTVGEWIELHNPGAAPIDLKGWVLQDDSSNKHTITKSLVIPPKGYRVLGRSSDKAKNGGVTVDYQYTSFTLSNSGDQIELRDTAGKQVDRVVYTSTWFVFAGWATALKQPGLDNNVRNNWCVPTGPWSGSAGDRGSPGAASSCAQMPPTGCTHTTTRSINFGSSLCARIMGGMKKITIRNNHWKTPKVGDWATMVCSGYGFTFEAKTTVLRNTTYGGITTQEYTDDGFTSQAQMLSVLQKYYSGITLASNATVIRWTGLTLCN